MTITCYTAAQPCGVLFTIKNSYQNEERFLKRFPRDATGQDFQTQQYFDISLIVHKSLIQENGDPIVEIDGNEKQLGKTTVGDYFHYSAFSLDNDWLITPSTQEKQVLISVDGGGQYQLIYNIQVE